MGSSWALEGANRGGGDALNQKVVDKFFLKVCTEREGARQGTWPQCPVSPLLSPLLIFSSFFSLNLSQVFFPSLYLFSFLFPSLLLSIISFLFPSFILPSSFLLSLSLPLFLPFSLFSPPSFFATFSFLRFFPFTLFLSNFFFPPPSLSLCISFSNFLFSFFYLAAVPDSLFLRSSLLFTL